MRRLWMSKRSVSVSGLSSLHTHEIGRRRLSPVHDEGEVRSVSYKGSV